MVNWLTALYFEYKKISAIIHKCLNIIMRQVQMLVYYITNNAHLRRGLRRQGRALRVLRQLRRVFLSGWVVAMQVFCAFFDSLLMPFPIVLRNEVPDRAVDFFEDVAEGYAAVCRSADVSAQNEVAFYGAVRFSSQAFGGIGKSAHFSCPLSG